MRLTYELGACEYQKPWHRSDHLAPARVGAPFKRSGSRSASTDMFLKVHGMLRGTIADGDRS